MGGMAVAGAALFAADTSDAHCVSGWIHMGGYEEWGGCYYYYTNTGCWWKNTWGGGCFYSCCNYDPTYGCLGYDYTCFYDCDGC
jgi:hypothetical protein